jgi:hypothetical protein
MATGTPPTYATSEGGLPSPWSALEWPLDAVLSEGGGGGGGGRMLPALSAPPIPGITPPPPAPGIAIIRGRAFCRAACAAASACGTSHSLSDSLLERLLSASNVSPGRLLLQNLVV